MSRSAQGLFIKYQFNVEGGVSPYLIIRKQFKTPEEWEAQLDSLRKSSTIYVGNLSFYTTESQIKEHFEAVGPIKRVIMVCMQTPAR